MSETDGVGVNKTRFVNERNERSELSELRGFKPHTPHQGTNTTHFESAIRFEETGLQVFYAGRI